MSLKDGLCVSGFYLVLSKGPKGSEATAVAAANCD